MTSVGSLANFVDNYSSSALTPKAAPGSPPQPVISVASTADISPATIATLSPGATSAIQATGTAFKSFADVTADARATLNANLATLKASGHALGFGENQGTQADIDAAFKGLDRRSLYAIASNSGGLFSKDEQTFARGVMSQQEVAAMGIDNPLNVLGDTSKPYLAGIRFLDSVSPEEKSSDNWRVDRAGVQVGYESEFRINHPGEKAQSVDSGDPVVNMLVKAIQNARGTWISVTDGSYVTDISKITLFRDGKYASELKQARDQLGQIAPQSNVNILV